MYGLDDVRRSNIKHHMFLSTGVVELYEFRNVRTTMKVNSFETKYLSLYNIEL